MTVNALPPKAVLFDFDGTLTSPGALNFAEIRQAIGCPQNKPILEYIDELPDENQRRSSRCLLETFEMRGAENSIPNSGAETVIRTLRSHGIAAGIISRNGIASIRRALQNFRGLCAADFDVIISRDDPFQPKPSAQGVQAAAEKWHISTDKIAVVGDYIFDIQAGRAAGAITIFLQNPNVIQKVTHDSDFTVSFLEEILPILRVSA